MTDLRRWTVFRIPAPAFFHSRYIPSDLRDHGGNAICLSHFSEFSARGVIFESLPDDIEHVIRLSAPDLPMSSSRAEIIEQRRHDGILLAHHLFGEDKYVLTHFQPRELSDVLESWQPGAIL